MSTLFYAAAWLSLAFLATLMWGCANYVRDPSTGFDAPAVWLLWGLLAAFAFAAIGKVVALLQRIADKRA